MLHFKAIIYTHVHLCFYIKLIKKIQKTGGQKADSKLIQRRITENVLDNFTGHGQT